MIVEVVGAVIRDATGRLLTVRKRGTARFMLPGGKREPGEDDLAALARELAEELGVRLASARLLGRFEAAAANEPGAKVRSSVYVVEITGEIAIQAEIEEMRWIDPVAPGGVALAPLLSVEILPALSRPITGARAAAPRATPSGSGSPSAELPAEPSAKRPGGAGS